MKNTHYSRLFFLLFFGLLIKGSILGQNLYEDAIRLSNAVKASQLVMMITADSTINVQGTLAKRSPINFALQPPGNIRRGLNAGMTYTLSSVNNDTFGLSGDT